MAYFPVGFPYRLVDFNAWKTRCLAWFIWVINKLAHFIFFIMFVCFLVGLSFFVKLIDVTVLEWLETLAKTLAPSQRTMVTALTCVAGGFVVAWAFEISRQHGERPTVRTIINSITSSFVSHLWELPAEGITSSSSHVLLLALRVGLCPSEFSCVSCRYSSCAGRSSNSPHAATLRSCRRGNRARRSSPSSAPCTRVAFCITSRTTRTPTASRAAHGLSSRPRGLRRRSAAQFGTTRSRIIKSFQARRGDTSW